MNWKKTPQKLETVQSSIISHAGLVSYKMHSSKTLIVYIKHNCRQLFKVRNFGNTLV